MAAICSKLVTIAKTFFLIIGFLLFVHGPYLIQSLNKSSLSKKIVFSQRPIHLLVLEENKLHQDAIELCSIYSVANSNPTRPVFVHTRFHLPEAILWSNLSNVFVTRINDSTVCSNTPAEKFYQKFLFFHLNTSVHAIAEMSDILRSCIVYKMGGTYVDSDIFQFKPFPDGNFVARQNGVAMCSVFDFNAGDSNLRKILAQLDSRYKPGRWGSVGPQLFKRVFASRDDTVFLNENVFFPISFPYALLWFTRVEMADEGIRRIMESDDTLGVHIFRAMFAFGRLKNYSSKSALGRLIRDHCPPVFAAKMVDGQFSFTRAIEK